MKQALKPLIIITLTAGFNLISGSAEGRNAGGTISDGNKTCRYSSDNGKWVKQCEDKAHEIAPSSKNTQGITEQPAVATTDFPSAPTTQQPEAAVPTTSTPPNDAPLSGSQVLDTQPQLTNAPSFLFAAVLAAIAFIAGYTARTIKNLQNWRGEDYIQDEAEKKVKAELSRLNKDHYCIMHDITLPTAEGTTQIDHMVFSEKGIFVVETKSHKGWIFGSEKDRNWTQVIRRRKYPFHNPLIQNNNHIKHIASLTNMDQGYLNNIVVFTSPEMELKTKLPDHVLKLTEIVPYIENHTANPFYDKRLYEVIGCIEFHRKERSIETNKKHAEFVKQRYG